MDSLGIAQAHSADSMMVVGGCETLSRLLTAATAGYIKGRLLLLYITCTAGLTILNVLSYFAYNYTHLLIYSAGITSYLFLFFIFAMKIYCHMCQRAASPPKAIDYGPIGTFG